MKKVKTKQELRREAPVSGVPAFLNLPRSMTIPILLVLAFVVYANSLGGQFVFDDTVIIQGNKTIRGLSWGHLKEIFGGHYWKAVESQGGLYRPVVMLTFAMNYALGGENPQGYHLLNTLFHALNGVLVFSLLEELFSRRDFSFLSALFFVLHPIRTEAVASVVGRAENLSTFFLLLAWWCYVRCRKGASSFSIGLSALLFVLATLTKESAFAFIALPPLADFFLGAGDLKQRFAPGRTMLRYLPYAAGIVFSLTLRHLVLGGMTPLYINPSSNPLAHHDGWARFLTATNVFGRYFWLLIFPLYLSADYSYNQIPVLSGIFSLSALVPICTLALLVVAVVISATRAPVLFFSGFLFFSTFLLTSNWIRPIGTLMAERLLYLPSLGFNCALAYVLCEGFERSRWKTAASLVSVVLLAGYGLRTINRNADWHDHVSLFSSAVRVSPNSSLAQANYATILLYEKNDVRGAIEHARKAADILPEDPAAHYTLGEAYRRLGDALRAAEAFEVVARLAPRTSGGVSALKNLAEVHESQGSYDVAAKDLEMLLEWRPTDTSASLSLARLYSRTGRRDRARAILRRAKQIAPQNRAVDEALKELSGDR